MDVLLKVAITSIVFVGICVALLSVARPGSKWEICWANAALVFIMVVVSCFLIKLWSL